MQVLADAIAKSSKHLFNLHVEPELTRPNPQFGDYSTNIAMQIAKDTGKPPREIAHMLVQELSGLPYLAKAPETAGPGFINFTLTDKYLNEQLDRSTQAPTLFENQKIVIEYSDPNPFKVLHVGHLYTSVVGDAIAKLLEQSGAKVHRVNFGGDVGLHVAKTIWSMLQDLGGENPDKLNEIKDKPQWMADNYVKGNNAYEDDEEAKKIINELNKKIYLIHANHDEQSPLAQIYWTTRGWSYDYFDKFYERIGTKFDKYYPESQTVTPGLRLVKDNMGKVFEESDGATVFKGEVHNLHTRVFINSQGLPTYETKDLGLAMLKWQDYKFNRSIIITGNEQYEYMQVVLKALEQIEPEISEKTFHITHGMVKLPGAEKMSSRKGNIVGAESVIDMAKQANAEANGKDIDEVAVGAVKYGFLKQRIGADIIFEPKEAVALEGNSGPYLQYAYARARSIMEKSSHGHLVVDEFDESERKLARKISEYPEILAEAAAELMPHHICTYLYELAQEFNRFYEKSRIIDDPREDVRIRLLEKYTNVLKSGLDVLGIRAPERI